MKIDVKIKKMERVPWESIQDLQPMDFKNDYHSEKIKQSILKNSYASPIHVWDDNGQLYAVDGHLRMDLLKELKSEGVNIPDTLPVVFLDLPDRETAVKYLLEVFNTKSNPINQESLTQWMEELDVTLEELDVSMDDLHVEIDQELEHLEEETVGDDDVPDVDNTKTITVKGDLYELGGHRVLCGDSTMIDDVERLMDGEKINLLLTDPPYNVAYEGKTKDAMTIQNDSMSNDDFRKFLCDVFRCADSVMEGGACFYIWHADLEGYNFRGACFDVGWQVRQCLIWVKNSMVMGRQDYHWKHEPCLYGWKEGGAHYWGSDRTQTTCLEFNRPTANRLHPTMKPVDLLEYQVLNNTRQKQNILDLFLGSGSTLIACEKTNRKCYGMELDEKYCDVVVRRWVNFMIENGNEDKIVLKRNGQDINYREFIENDC